MAGSWSIRVAAIYGASRRAKGTHKLHS